MVTYHVELHLLKRRGGWGPDEPFVKSSVDVRAHDKFMANDVAHAFTKEMGWPHSRVVSIKLVEPCQYVESFDFPDEPNEDK